MKKLGISFCLLAIVLLLVGGCSKKKESAPDTPSKGMGLLESIEGIWNGSINVPGQPLPIILTFENEKGTISIPAQGLVDYPLASVKLDGSDISIKMNIQTQLLTFVGTIDQEKITGTFTQQGQSFPFELEKGTKSEDLEEDNLIQIETKGGMMTAVLETPKGEGPFPLMVIIAGSGPTDHDGNSPLFPGKNNSLKLLAEGLAADGVASIRYDKRGIGKNAHLIGKEEDERFDNFIEDAVSWAQYAQKDQQFSEVGIIGHSEGSLIGMVAAAKANVDTFISIAGAGRPIDEVLLEQLTPQLPASLLEESSSILEKLKQGEQVATVSQELQSLFRPSVQPYMISWLHYNPAIEIQKLTIPVLIINGTRDIQVPVKDAEQLHLAKNDSTLLIVEKMNHILKESPEDQEGNLATYSNPDLPLANGLLDGIIDFFKKPLNE